MVSENPDELRNSFWGPQVKRLIDISQALLKYKEKPYQPFIATQKNLLHITNQDEIIRCDSKDFRYRQIKHENQTLWVMTVTCFITITKWKDKAQNFLFFVVHNNQNNNNNKKSFWETHLLTTSFDILERAYYAV